MKLVYKEQMIKDLRQLNAGVLIEELLPRNIPVALKLEEVSDITLDHPYCNRFDEEVKETFPLYYHYFNLWTYTKIYNPNDSSTPLYFIVFLPAAIENDHAHNNRGLLRLTGILEKEGRPVNKETLNFLMTQLSLSWAEFFLYHFKGVTIYNKGVPPSYQCTFAEYMNWNEVLKPAEQLSLFEVD